MNTKKRSNLIDKILGKGYNSGEECLYYCPVCKHQKRKLSLNFSKNNFKCWICDYRGRNIFSIVRKYGSFSEREQWKALSGYVEISEFQEIKDKLTESNKEEEKEILEMPEGFKSFTAPANSIYYKKAINYLYRRGLTFEDILKWKIGFCTTGDYAGRIIIPSFDNDGDLNYFIARSYEQHPLKYKNPPKSKDLVFNELFVNWEEEITLVEGVFDAVVAPNSIPILGSSLKYGSRAFEKICQNETPVYVALDPDAEIKSLKIIKDLLESNIEVYKINISGFDDVGEMPKSVFLERKQEALEMNNENGFKLRIMESFYV